MELCNASSLIYFKMSIDMLEYTVDINHLLHHYTSGIHQEYKWKIRSINVHYNIAVFWGRFFFSFHLSFVNLILRWMSCCRIYSFEFNTIRRNIFIFKNSLHQKKIVSFFFTDGKYYKNNLILTDFFFSYEGVTQNGDPHHKIHM